MAINVQHGDIVNPQRLAMLGFSENASNPPNTPDQRVMIVYSGWIDVNFSFGSGLARDRVVSFVPNGDGTIQKFKQADPELGDVEAVVTASLSSIANNPDFAAIDRATVAFESTRQFPGQPGFPRVLILRGNLAVDDGAVRGIAYQVTVLAHPDLLDGAMTVSSSQTP